MFEVDKLSSFFTKLAKNNMGAPDAPLIGGITGPIMPPMLFFSKNKNYLSNQMHSFFQEQKLHGGIMSLP